MTTPANPQPTSTDDAGRYDLLSMMPGLDGLSAQHLADAILAAGFRRAPATEAGEDKAALWKEAAELRALAFDAKSKAYDQARAEADALRKALVRARDVASDGIRCDAKFSADCRSCGILDILNEALATHPAASATTTDAKPLVSVMDAKEGQYECRCATCYAGFLGHKRDKTCPNCKRLAAEAEAQRAAALPAPQPARDAQAWVLMDGDEIVRLSTEKPTDIAPTERCVPLYDNPPTAAAGVTESWTPEQWVAASSAGYDELAKCGSHPSPRFVRMAIAAGIAAALAAAQMRTGE